MDKNFSRRPVNHRPNRYQGYQRYSEPRRYPEQPKRRKSNKILKIFAVLLILAGIGIMLVPVIGTQINSKKQEQLMDDFEKKMKEEIKYEEEISGTPTPQPSITITSLPDPNEASGPPANNVDPLKSMKVIGILNIPKISLKLPVVEGSSPENLKVALGHITGTTDIGKNGNCVIAGHRNYTFGMFFNRLDELVEGDIINITSKSGTFKYQVFEKIVVEPTDLSVLQADPNQNILSLLTCHPLYVGSHRLIVKSRLVN